MNRLVGRISGVIAAAVLVVLLVLLVLPGRLISRQPQGGFSESGGSETGGGEDGGPGASAPPEDEEPDGVEYEILSASGYASLKLTVPEDTVESRDGNGARFTLQTEEDETSEIYAEYLAEPVPEVYDYIAAFVTNPVLQSDTENEDIIGEMSQTYAMRAREDGYGAETWLIPVPEEGGAFAFTIIYSDAVLREILLTAAQTITLQ